MPRRSRKVFRNGRIHVMAGKCATCIFRRGNLMHLNPGRIADIVQRATKARTAIVCHETLDGDEAVCRGFYDGYKTEPLKLAKILGIITEVKPNGTAD